MAETRGDDRLTVVAVAALAYIVPDVLHEALGHGVTAWLSGAHRLTLSTVALSSDIDTRLISAGGTLVNLIFAAVFWILLRGAARYRPVTRYFLVLTLIGNLFDGTGYFFFSGVAGIGDWADVIRGLDPHLAWRVGLAVMGAALYYASMVLVSRELEAFREPGASVKRLARLCWTPYITEGVLAVVAGVLNPAGLIYVLISALPSTLGANAGLLALPGMMKGWKPVHDGDSAGPMARSWGWIAAGGIASAIFIVVLGRGITWTGT